MEEFGSLSGLVCTVEKTVILPIGNNVNFDDRIVTLGFQLADKLTILGLEISNKGFTEKNFDNIVNKIRSQVGAWRPYNLSLPGRINIAKTMLYSQINYLGCFLPVPVETIRIIDTLITDYVKGNLNIAKKRIYLPPDQGGLGLFDIQDFLDAQKCSWIKRSVNLNERWKVILYISNFGCIFNAKVRNIDVTESPICRQICASYEKFCNFFTTVDENFRKMFIFENSKITMDTEGRETFSRTKFMKDSFRLHASKLYQLRYGDLFDEENNFLSRDRIRDRTNIDFTPLQIFQLRNACWVARTKYAKREPIEQKSFQIETFLFRRKKGSNHIRKVLSSKTNNGIRHNIRKFADNLDIVITGEQSKFLNKLWTDNIFTNAEKVFLFKLHNNTLGFNNAVAHFVRGHTPFCTFCKINRIPDPNIETPLHLFHDCNHVHDVLTALFKSITNDNDFVFSKRELFTNFDRRGFSIAKNTILTTCAKFLLKYLWDCKNRQCTPNSEDASEMLRDRLAMCKKHSRKFNILWANAGLFEPQFADHRP